MMSTLRTRLYLTAFLLAGVLVGVTRSQERTGDISESEIVSLKKELAEAGEVVFEDEDASRLQERRPRWRKSS